jgi:hypothetical protein
MSAELTVPVEDRAYYASLPEAVRNETKIWMQVISRVRAADKPLAEIAVQARALAGMKGFSAVNMRTKYYLFKHSENWRCLVNHAKVGRKVVSLPEAFIEHWKACCERNQRKSRPSWRAMIEEWKAGARIPGYERGKDHAVTGAATGVFPEAGVGGIPDGWSYRNLLKYAPTPYELGVARIGRSSSANCRPLVYSTRVGLQPGQFYFFDDLEHDIKVNFLGVNRKAMRPLELCCMDLFSACKVAWGMKPTIEDDGIKQKLKEREMRFLLAYVVTRIGYRPEGTTLGVEHGTAAIRDDLEKILHDASDGAIVVNRSGIEGAAALVYEGRGKGNFRFKAGLESSHNLFHNELAALPGQMGMDRDHSPEELHGREKNNNALIKAMAFLPEERAALLRMPFLEFHAFMTLAGQVYEKINGRDWHDLEGWVEAGLLAHEFRLALDLPWMSANRILQAPEQERKAITALISAPGLTRIRKLSPMEVWTSGRERLTRLPGYLAPQIMGQENGVERKVLDNGLFEFEDRELGPGTFRYLARLASASSHSTNTSAEEILPVGQTFQTFCNPFDPGVLHVCKAGTGEGAYIGMCPRWEKVNRADVEAVHRQMGAAAHEETKRLLPYQARHTQEMRQHAADAKWNAGVLSGKAMTVQDKQLAQEIKDTRVTGEDVAAMTGRDETEKGKVYSAEEIAEVLKT